MAAASWNATRYGTQPPTRQPFQTPENRMPAFPQTSRPKTNQPTGPNTLKLPTSRLAHTHLQASNQPTGPHTFKSSPTHSRTSSS